MANLTYTSADLEVVATMYLIGPRNLRLEVLNVFRAQNGEEPVEYLVNAHVPTYEAFTIALDNVSEAT